MSKNECVSCSYFIEFLGERGFAVNADAFASPEAIKHNPQTSAGCGSVPTVCVTDLVSIK